jgi:hypothetical protein
MSCCYLHGLPVWLLFTWFTCLVIIYIVYMFCCCLHGLQAMETLRPMGRYTIQPLYVNISDDEATRMTTYYGRFAAPPDLENYFKGTLIKGKHICLLNRYCRNYIWIYKAHCNSFCAKVINWNLPPNSLKSHEINPFFTLSQKSWKETFLRTLSKVMKWNISTKSSNFFMECWKQNLAKIPNFENYKF